MESDAELWVFLRQRDRFGTIRFIYHQAGGCENALPVRLEYG